MFDIGEDLPTDNWVERGCFAPFRSQQGTHSCACSRAVAEPDAWRKNRQANMRTAIAGRRMVCEAQKLQEIVHTLKTGRWRTVGQARLESMSAMPRWLRRAFVAWPKQ